MAKKTAKKRVSAKQQAINDAYKKERSRVLSFINRAEKRGYNFQKNIVPKVPKQKKEGSIRNLQKLTKEYLYSKATYHGEASYGEEISAEEGRRLERSLRSKRAAETRKKKKEAERKFWTSTDGTKTPVTDEPVLAFTEAVDEIVDKLREIITTMDVYYYTNAKGKRARRKPEAAEIADSALNEIIATLDAVIEEAGLAIIRTLPKELQDQYTPAEVGKNKVGSVLSKNWENIERWLGHIQYDSDGGTVMASARSIINVLNDAIDNGFGLSESAMRSFDDLDDMMDYDY
nr:MAG TPA: hypothetical protein [Caudoviricetes sp.]